MDKKDIKYFNFPIELLQGFLTNHMICLDNILYYAVMKNAEKMAVMEGHKLNEDTYNRSQEYFNVKIGLKFNLVSVQFQFLKTGLKNENVVTGIETTIFWDYYKNEKTEYQKAVLLAFLAIKSLLHGKSCIKTYNLTLWSRMDGKVKSIKKDELHTLSPAILKYCTEYQTAKKIKPELQHYWNLKHYGIAKGFYVSFSMTKEQLTKHAETKKRKYLDEKLKQETRAIKAKVLEELGVKPPKRTQKEPATTPQDPPAENKDREKQGYYGEDLIKYGFKYSHIHINDWTPQIINDYDKAMENRAKAFKDNPPNF